MAVLNATQLTQIRGYASTSNGRVSYTKPSVNATVQAIEDWWTTNQASLDSAISAAAVANGISLSAGARADLITAWMKVKVNA